MTARYCATGLLRFNALVMILRCCVRESFLLILNVVFTTFNCLRIGTVYFAHARCICEPLLVVYPKYANLCISNINCPIILQQPSSIIPSANTILVTRLFFHDIDFIGACCAFHCMGAAIIQTNHLRIMLRAHEMYIILQRKINTFSKYNALSM